MLLATVMGETGSASSGGVFGGRYRSTRLLKRGLGIDTYLGVDLSSGGPVVVKQVALSDVSPGVLLRLEHDAEVLRSLDVPTLAPLLAMGREQDVFWVATPFIPGSTLARRLARTGRLWVPDALAVGRGLMQALQAVHERGVLHRDVKPANVFVGDGSPPDRVTLCDFGLARGERADASPGGLPAGAVAYLSPEQAGLIHAEVGERSDLYSAGIVLFECLAGRPPFRGRTVGDLLRQHLAVEPPALGYAVPRALTEVVHRLLAKDPRDRYQSAAAARADLDEIAAALERGVRQPDLAVGGRDRRRALTEPAFVGREEELRAFEDELARTFRGESILLCVEGESGAGKTRVLDQAAVIARQHGAWVLRGQCTDRAAAQRPLQVLDGVVAGIVQAARGEAGFAEALRARLGEHLQALGGALPGLLDLLVPGMLVSLGPEAHGERRLLPALIALVDALGSPERPVVILLDDCQWLDELSLKLLASWQRARRDAPGAGGALLAAAYRSDEVSIDSPLRRLAPAPRIRLGPLSDADAGRMAESMAGALPSDAISHVVTLGEGNPFLVAAALEGLVECGALVDGPHAWELEPRAMARVQSSRRAAALLAQRLDQLSASALELLSVGAVLGKSFELKLAADLADHSPAEAMAGVTDARRRHLVWLESPDRCTFVHDRLREAVLRRLAPAERTRLHRAAALALEQAPGGPDRSFDLAYHFDAAGEHRRALPHALAAAAQARARYALETAEHLYRIAERGAAEEDGGAPVRHEVAEALGDVLLLRGKYDEAGARLSQARALARSPVERAAIEGKLGELAFKRGDVRAASDALERALRLLGRRVPTRRAGVVTSMLWQALVQVAHTLLPRRLVARRRIEDGAADLLAARLLSRLAYANWFLRGQAATFWAHLSELNLAERYPPTRELAQACSEHAISVTGLPRLLFGRGVRYAERGLAIRRELGDLWGQGQSLNFHGILLYAFGHYPAAREKFGEALRLLRRTGDRWEANIAAVHVAFCHYRLGALREAVEECRRVHREGVEIGDAHAMGSALEVWAKATGGAVSPELIDAALRSPEGDAQTRAMVLQADGVRLLGAGRPEDAARAFQAADAAARSARLESEYVSYVPLWIAHALRRASARAAVATGVLLPARTREAEAALRRGLRSARRYRGNLPMALRERAHLRAMQGRFRAARRDVDASLAEAERQGARLEAALSLLARGALGVVLGWSGAEAEATRARTLLHEMGAGFACSGPDAAAPAGGAAPQTLSQAARSDAIVEHGRRIAAAAAPDDVHAALCEAASVLLRGDVSLVLSTEGGEPRPLRGLGGPRDVVGSLVERAVREGRPVVLGDLPDERRSERVEPGPRSALCAPILVNGRSAACLYVGNGRVSDVFSDGEKHLAGYLAELAGASLERAEAFTALRGLARTPEQRVAERTGELATTDAELGATLRRSREHSTRDPSVGREVVSLAEMVQRVVSLASPKARRHAVAIEVAMPSDPWQVSVSGTQIESALLSVVDNAIDASSPGAVVRIEAVPRERRSRRGVEVRVCDRPSIESRPGEGTTAWLWLPTCDPASARGKG